MIFFKATVTCKVLVQIFSKRKLIYTIYAACFEKSAKQ